jgi:integrase
MLGAITVRSVQALRPSQTIWDAGHREAVRGFGVRRQRGNPFYVIKYRVHGRQRFVTIGPHGPWTPDKARREAKRLLGLVADGKDPQAEKIEARAKAADTIGKVADDYLKHAREKLKPRSYVETERHLLVNWKPLHPISVFHLRRRQVAQRLTEITAERSSIVAARARAALSAMFNWAIREGYDIPGNPVFGSNRPADAKSRTRVLADSELAAIWRACGDDDYGRIVKLLMLTAQRRDEVGGIYWAEIDKDKKLWTIPSARTKNHREHIVPLSDPALALVEALPPRKDRDQVFGNGKGGYSGWSKSKEALDERIAEARKKPLPGWRLHDLRRTASTVMADRLGVLPHIIEAVLNHVSGHKGGVAGIYNRAPYEREKRETLELWAAHVEALIVDPRKQPVPTGLMERAFAVARAGKIVPDEDLADLARQLKNNVTPLKRA